MSLPVSGVILDLDGLLLDTERLAIEAGPVVLRRFGHEIDPQFFHRTTGVDQYETHRMVNQAVGDDIAFDTFNDAWNDVMYALMTKALPFRPGVEAFFDALDRWRLPRAIATNSVTSRAEWKLQRVGLLDRVDAVVALDQVEKGKPAPDLFIEAARRIHLEPSECAALDDSDTGVRAAVTAGIKLVIQVPDMMPSRELLAHHQAESLDAARAILGI
jgi:HAD superfamily hydrolase (TIGR01509 family)